MMESRFLSSDGGSMETKCICDANSLGMVRKDFYVICASPSSVFPYCFNSRRES